MFETSVFATARLRGEKWRKNPQAPFGELLILLLLQTLGLDSVGSADLLPNCDWGPVEETTQVSSVNKLEED